MNEEIPRITTYEKTSSRLFRKKIDTKRFNSESWDNLASVLATDGVSFIIFATHTWSFLVNDLIRYELSSIERINWQNIK